jgi:hypothetical protein
LSFSKKVLRKPNAQFIGNPLSVNTDFRNEIAKTSPILALSEEFNEPPNVRMKKLAH